MIYAVANQKGGVGKSSTAIALLAGLTKRGYKCLAIDLDAQQNLTYASGANMSGKTALGVLTGEFAATEAIQQTPIGDIIASSPNLAAIDYFIRKDRKEYVLADALSPLVASYDYIIIDTPPALSNLTVNALTVADRLIIPAQADAFSLQGIKEFAKTYAAVKQYTNPRLTIAGILLTRYNARSVLSKDVAELIQQYAEQLGTDLFKTAIREGITVKEAQMVQQSLFDYAPKAKVTADYKSLINELLAAEKL